ncbi:S-adenosyl-L-methionine-dependent methyltransferase [Panus rudis PR-1116 ss-1]|nr:S-adenosyl-L-methionine-dependent methyltransferase [Panus rudis PR-1116 ss-1]
MNPDNRDHEVNENGSLGVSRASDVDEGEDNDWSDTSSDITEIDLDEIPTYFSERDGRLFHAHGSSPYPLYPLPVDAAEQNRINGQHGLLRELIGRNYVGPVQEVLRPIPLSRQPRALDLGTGTGRWVLEMAAEFPHVHFKAVDIVPIATMHPPDNVDFEIHDINEEFRYESGSFDLVHGRSISMAVHHYPDVIEKVARVLHPGGLFLACEWGRYPAMAGGVDPQRYLPHSQAFFRAIIDTLYRTRGIRPVASRLEEYIESSGYFTNIRQRRFSVPIGPWHSDQRLQQIGAAYRDMVKVYASSMSLMMVQAGESQTEVARLLQGYLYELDNVAGMVSHFYTVHAIRL